MNGDKKTGVNIMKLDDGLDTGDICKKIVIEIKETDNNESLSIKLSKLGAEVLMQAVIEAPRWKPNFHKTR